MISKESIKMLIDNSVKEIGCDDVESLTNEQMLDIIADAIAKSVPSVQEMDRELGKRAIRVSRGGI